MGALDATGICSHHAAHCRWLTWVETGIFLAWWEQDLLAARIRLALHRKCVYNPKLPGAGFPGLQMHKRVALSSLLE